MSDKNTLTIDVLNSSINVSTESNNSVEENQKLKLVLNTVLAKSKSVLLATVGLLFFGGFWSLLSAYTQNALPTPRNAK
jgi:nitrate/nitrite transport system permease protein